MSAPSATGIFSMVSFSAMGRTRLSHEKLGCKLSLREAKNPASGSYSRLPHLLLGNALNLRNLSHNLPDMEGLVALTAVRYRCYVRRIGLGKEHVKRRVAYHLVIVTREG